MMYNLLPLLMWSGILCFSQLSSATLEKFSFSYEQGTQQKDTSIRIQERLIPDRTGEVYLYCTFNPLSMNPAPLVDGQPQGIQNIAIGHTDNDFTPVIHFGIVKDTHTGFANIAYLLPWMFDGQFDYYGMYLRPETSYNFKIKLNLDSRNMTVWISGRGDDRWFMLAEEVPLINPVPSLNTIRVEQNTQASGIDIYLDSQPWPEGEKIKPHPLAKKNRTVGPDQGFRFQSMRSCWNQSGRHVTIARNNPNHTPRQSAWLGFPDVVQTDPDTLVCNYVDGSAHGGGGQWWVAHSLDLGKTWIEKNTMGSGAACMRLQKLRDGSLFMSEPRFFQSTDGGFTWQRTGQLDPVLAGGHAADVASHIAELADGSWLLAGSESGNCPTAFTCTDGESLEIYRSGDWGKTWSFLSSIKEWPRGLSEPSIVVMPSGRLWLFSREGHSLFPGIKTFSDDNGKTWAPLEEMPFPVIGRTCADRLKDGRVLLTFRAHVGRCGIWAWAGDPEEKTKAQIVGAHFNDSQSIGLKEGQLHIDNDGYSGQFTQYFLRIPDSPDSSIDVTVELKVLSNFGRAATLSIPYVGKLRFFPDRVESGHDASLKIRVEPDVFHTYRIVRQGPQMTLSIDGKEVLVTDKIVTQTVGVNWTPIKTSPYLFAFGNEPTFDPIFELTDQQGQDDLQRWSKKYQENVAELDDLAAIPPVLMISMGLFTHQITPQVTGCSLWRRIEVKMEDPRTGLRKQSWYAGDGFPDQYQLDRVVEVDASIAGCDQGYTGWTELTDGRIFVVNYTDDTAPTCPQTPDWPSGLPWIRGTWLSSSDLVSPVSSAN